MEEGRLFEVKRLGKGRVWFWSHACSVLLGLALIWAYRFSHVPEAGEKGRWAWIAVFCAEMWFSFYWLLTLSVRFNPVRRHTFKARLSDRYSPASSPPLPPPSSYFRRLCLQLIRSLIAQASSTSPWEIIAGTMMSTLLTQSPCEADKQPQNTPPTRTVHPLPS
ncbi:Cellulose synthase-like protein E2 [Platanthera zijinensis]|uniref:Cellulose synthase-like protein E2 n=1 Tax=Platanthera zijinensis TaxID=2320716 RepID=A0AAP0BGL7_9ASPA